jgi:hypothetical protein
MTSTAAEYHAFIAGPFFREMSFQQYLAMRGLK